MKLRRHLIPIAVALAIVLMSGVALACPMCKDSVPNSDAPAAGGLPSGFNNSVYFVLLGFFAVLASVCGLIFKAVRETGVKPAGFAVLPPPSMKTPKSDD